jgi:hypothetical protein
VGSNLPGNEIRVFHLQLGSWRSYGAAASTPRCPAPLAGGGGVGNIGADVGLGGFRLRVGSRKLPAGPRSGANGAQRGVSWIGRPILRNLGLAQNASFGGSAVSGRPVALRTGLAAGVPLSGRRTAKCSAGRQKTAPAVGGSLRHRARQKGSEPHLPRSQGLAGAAGGVRRGNGVTKGRSRLQKVTYLLELGFCLTSIALAVKPHPIGTLFTAPQWQATSWSSPDSEVTANAESPPDQWSGGLSYLCRNPTRCRLASRRPGRLSPCSARRRSGDRLPVSGYAQRGSRTRDHLLFSGST